MPSRRQFLAGSFAAATTATTGCLGVLSDADDSQVSSQTLTLDLSREGENLRGSFVTDLSSTPPDWDEEAFEAVLSGENYTTQYRKPFYSTAEDPTYIKHDETYYLLGSVVVGEAAATQPVLRISRVEDTDPSNATSHAKLSEHDQRAIRVAYFAARARGNEGGIPSGLVQRGGYVYRNDEAAAESDLLAEDGPDRVTYRDSVYAVKISRERFYEPIYRATLEPVAESQKEMEAILRAKFVDARISRDVLSSDARDVLEAARTDSYDETHPYSAGFREVLRALHARPYIDGNIKKDAGVDTEGRQMIRYAGVYYDYVLGFLREPNP